MEIRTKIPFYAKAALIFVGLFAFLSTLYIGQRIIIPILFATIVAILLNPIVGLLTAIKINKIVAITLAVLFAIAVVIGILFIISSQLSVFNETYPQLKEKFNQKSYDIVQWVSHKFNIKQYKITSWVKESQEDAIDSIALGAIISQAGRVMFVATLLPVYVFMILYYKPLLLEFIRKLFKHEHHTTVAEVLLKTKKIVQTYLVGLFFEMIIIAVLNSVGLLILNIDYAVILGITGAIINIIPYVGGIIAIILPMIIAFVTKDSITYPLLVLGTYLLIQFIDVHYIVPRVVAKRVKLNALISVIVVLIGGALWGVPGLFLSIPLTAIIKVIFDHIEPLKPWGFLLGNTVPTTSKFLFVKPKRIKTQDLKHKPEII